MYPWGYWLRYATALYMASRRPCRSMCCMGCVLYGSCAGECAARAVWECAARAVCCMGSVKDLVYTCRVVSCGVTMIRRIWSTRSLPFLEVLW